MTKTKEIEFVLPSGAFARFKSPTLRQWISCADSNPQAFLANIAAACTTIDGKQIPLSEWMDLDYEDIAPVFRHINAFLERCIKSGGGVS